MSTDIASSTNSWLPSHNIVDSLNQVMDSVSVLSDVELEKEISIFANAQFTYDITPGAAVDDKMKPENDKFQQPQQYTRKKSNQQPNMHSLLNVKLASLAENNYHTTMSPDAIAKFYDESPDCSPPNGYHSPNPTPPNGFYSPNPTPPNGYHLTNSPAFQGVVNPPITFHGEDAIMGYHDDQFMKTMRVLTGAYNEPQQQQQQQLQNYDHIKSPIVTDIKKPSNTSNNLKKKCGSISSSTPTVKKSSPLVKQDLPAVDSEDEDDDVSQEYDLARRSSSQQPPLTREDKRRRNTAASARFRVKKKLREQALQQTANEMTEKAKAFENRVHELELEVKWLKALIVEKKDGQLEQMLMQQFDRRPPSGFNGPSINSQHSLPLDKHQQHGYLGNDV